MSKSKPQKAKLKPKYEIFCREYLKSNNATKAAIAAGCPTRGAATTAGRLLKNAEILKRLDELQAPILTKLDFDLERILGELRKIGDIDPRGVFKDDGTFKDPKDWPEALAKCISSIEVKEIKNKFTGEVIGYTKKVKFWDKVKALELLGKNKRGFTDVVESNVNAKIAVVDPKEVSDAIDKFNDEF